MCTDVSLWLENLVFNEAYFLGADENAHCDRVLVVTELLSSGIECSDTDVTKLASRSQHDPTNNTRAPYRQHPERFNF